jgi:hypothetical protein
MHVKNRVGLNFSSSSRSLARVSRLRVSLLLTAASIFVAGSVLAVHFGPRVYYRFVPPRARVHRAASEEAAALREAAARFSGRIVWSSNRSGNHEIYLADLRGKSPVLAQLTDDPHVDSFPRFSADGSEILFNRSRDVWVSDRDTGPWDVWLMDADGRHARRIAEDGFHPTFTPDGRSVVFTRGDQVIRHDIGNDREDVLLNAGEAVGGAGYEPDLRDHRLAMTVRGRGRRAFGIYDLEARTFIAFPGSSCQIAWWPGQEKVIWIEGHEGQGGTRVAAGTPDGRHVETLIDLPGRFSHEYFPRLSRDGAWLAWAASAGDHEPGRADYEIFLWKVGDAPDRALRLTYDTGNDQWPDLTLG